MKSEDRKKIRDIIQNFIDLFYPLWFAIILSIIFWVGISMIMSPTVEVGMILNDWKEIIVITTMLIGLCKSLIDIIYYNQKC